MVGVDMLHPAHAVKRIAQGQRIGHTDDELRLWQALRQPPQERGGVRQVFNYIRHQHHVGRTPGQHLRGLGSEHVELLHVVKTQAARRVHSGGVDVDTMADPCAAAEKRVQPTAVGGATCNQRCMVGKAHMQHALLRDPAGQQITAWLGMSDNPRPERQIVAESLAQQIGFNVWHRAIIGAPSTRMHTRYILLLQEDMAVGGIHTATQALANALRCAGQIPVALALRNTRIGALLRAVWRADIIVATNGFLPSYAAWLLGMLLRRPVVAWLHGPTQEVLEHAHASAAKRAWLRWLYRRLRWVVFVSAHTRDSFLEFTGGAAAGQRLEVIPNAHPDWQPAPMGASPQYLGFVGRLAPEKQPELLVQMLRLLPTTYRLCMVGDGPSQPALCAAGADLQQVGRLELRPFHLVQATVYAPWQVTVLASLYEGCPMAALESLAAGRPCVGLPIPALREMLGPDMPYALAHDCSAAALARAVQTVCAMPPEQLAHDMAQVLRRYSPERFSHNWQRVLQEAAC